MDAYIQHCFVAAAVAVDMEVNAWQRAREATRLATEIEQSGDHSKLEEAVATEAQAWTAAWEAESLADKAMDVIRNIRLNSAKGIALEESLVTAALVESKEVAKNGRLN